MALKFKSGDKVFAKVRGYPFWPARIEECAGESPSRMKYNVFFYGTAETAICKPKEVVPYAPNKDTYGKSLKRKGFNEGLLQIEMEINGTVPAVTFYVEGFSDNNDTKNEGSLVIDKNSASPDPTPLPTDMKKKKLTGFVKRKSVDNLSEDYASKSKQARLSSVTPNISSGVDEDSPKSKVKAGSPLERQIKLKKFANKNGQGVDDSHKNKSVSITSGFPAEAQTSFAVPPVKIGSSIDPSVLKGSKSQTNLEESFSLTLPFPDKSAKTSGGTQGHILSGNPNRAVIAKALLGQCVQIKLDVERPASFESEESRRLWDITTGHNAERLKNRIELGELLPDNIQKQLEGKEKLTDAQRTELMKERELTHKRGILRWLKEEAHLLELDAQIRASLSLLKADARLCLQLMDDLLAVNIDPLMLKKHPNIVVTVKKLQRYVGNASKWSLTTEETEKFNSNCEQIRLKAKDVYHKFEALFVVPTNSCFWDVFHEEVQRFNKAVKHLSVDKVYSLVVDPEKVLSLHDSEEDVEEDDREVVEEDDREDVEEEGDGEEEGLEQAEHDGQEDIEQDRQEDGDKEDREDAEGVGDGEEEDREDVEGGGDGEEEDREDVEGEGDGEEDGQEQAEHDGQEDIEQDRQEDGDKEDREDVEGGGDGEEDG